LPRFQGDRLAILTPPRLAGGAFLDSRRNVILIGGAGTGKSHIAIASWSEST